MTILSVADLLQEAAGNHAVAMWGRSEAGFATDPRLSEAGLIFVMTRMHVEMDAYPRWGDLVQLETWFQPSGRVGAERQWRFKAQDGAVVGRAVASFVMVNMNTRRLAKMPEPIRKHSAWFQRTPPELAIEHSRTRARIPDVLVAPDEAEAAQAAGDGQESAPPRRRSTSSSSDGEDAASAPTLEAALAALAQAGVAPALPEEALVPPPQTAHAAKRADMDMNGHVNNVAYLGWLLENVPEAVFKGARLARLEIDYRAEATAGQVVRGSASVCECPEGAFEDARREGGAVISYAHRLERTREDGKVVELARARTTWIF